VSALRRISTRRLLLICALALAVVGGGTAVALAATSGSGETPPPKPLANAVEEALNAPEVPGISARIEFTNNLIDASSIQGADPILAGATGRKPIASGGAAAFAVLGFLINGFAPLVDAIDWLKYLSPFYYYEGSDPIANGVDVGDLAVLLVAAAVLTGVAVYGFGRRDLRG